MEHNVIQDCNNSFTWRVESINHLGEGECYIATFTGPLAEERARHYAVMLRLIKDIHGIYDPWAK